MFLTDLDLRFLDDRSKYPFITLSELVYKSEMTGETYVVPKHFRTDGASIPEAISLIPGLGQALFLRYFGNGVFHGFRQGVLHDHLRRKDKSGKTPVPAVLAHRIFREALYEAGYPPDLCETYYAAVLRFNS